ncbi:TetR/AcrR family transcriptional regulator [Streptomyces sp. NPDC050560]|uniref:TetR/AcrR family transcriptional regulator n=1 Tax=Streptomyces sp. NPDC050560 TaxID=3365630 RepID=UPI0037A808DE
MADATTASRKLTAKGRATRARILGVAADLILENGIAGTQIDDVRRAAGVSGSQMTHYFRDKQNLVEEVISWQAQATLDDHTQPRLGNLDSFESLRLWAHLVVERQKAVECRGGCRFGSLAGQLVESGPDIRSELAEGFEQLLAVFRKGMLAMRDRGDLRPDADPEALSHVLLGAMQGGMLLTQTLRRVEPLRDALRNAVARVESFAATAPGEALSA